MKPERRVQSIHQNNSTSVNMWPVPSSARMANASSNAARGALRSFGHIPSFSSFACGLAGKLYAKVRVPMEQINCGGDRPVTTWSSSVKRLRLKAAHANSPRLNAASASSARRLSSSCPRRSSSARSRFWRSGPASWTSGPTPPCEGCEDDDAAGAPAKPMPGNGSAETTVVRVRNPRASSNSTLKSVSATGTPIMDNAWFWRQAFCLRLFFARLLLRLFISSYEPWNSAYTSGATFNIFASRSPDHAFRRLLSLAPNNSSSLSSWLGTLKPLHGTCFVSTCPISAARHKMSQSCAPIPFMPSSYPPIFTNV